MEKRILITGGAGFIGSHVIRNFIKKYPNYLIVNFDKLTYAGNLENLVDIEAADNYDFIKGDITDINLVKKVFEKYKFDSVIHLAAESHVDRSILDPLEFVQTNIIGTANLLNAAKESWANDFEGKLFYHVSTDEVFGSLSKTGFFTEKTSYDPRSPYSASKAGSDHLVRAYFHTYSMPTIISNCSNNYGPNQFPEKLIPLAINNIVNKKQIPIYGKGDNVRDWLYVLDHANAIEMLFHKGEAGETYNIGGDNEWTNLDLIRNLCQILDDKLNREKGESEKLITFVKDREGHDLRYAIDFSKINKQFDWKPSLDFKTGLENTVDWYLTNKKWLENVVSGDYLNFYKKQYDKR
ncbi:MAG: dTDP-glucose 4,6-dehydratase [Bacteroidales bacterium]|nr:dTDP-glucose 4,6-dehydratase [Bacteroidales bacterium]MBN2756181.1 dTDP-glucose 4,6-dehydratase [Bacteroidales bacterium]